LRRRRLLAGLVDGLLILAAALLMADSLGERLSARAALALRIGEVDSFWRGPLPFLLSFVGSLTHALPLAALLLLAPEASAAGAGPGKLLLRMQVAGRPGARGRRFLVKTAGCWLHLAGLALAWWPLLAAALVAYALIGLGALPLATGGAALHDRLGGARVAPIAPRA
jgi:hypothetical protein